MDCKLHDSRDEVRVTPSALTFARGTTLLLHMDDPKDIEKHLFRCAPQAVKDLNAKAKRLVRQQKRAEWWKTHADQRSRKPLSGNG
jgi:hypothetical protein